MRRVLACSLMLATGCFGDPHPRAGGFEEPEVDEPPPRAAIDAGAFPGAGGDTTGLTCFHRDALPADCHLAGEWRLLHGMPEGDCPFGASRHDIALAEV